MNANRNPGIMQPVVRGSAPRARTSSRGYPPRLPPSRWGGVRVHPVEEVGRVPVGEVEDLPLEGTHGTSHMYRLVDRAAVEAPPVPAPDAPHAIWGRPPPPPTERAGRGGPVLPCGPCSPSRPRPPRRRT